eukprot:15511539-Heterocapsa_arctica.AAC.1
MSTAPLDGAGDARPVEHPASWASGAPDRRSTSGGVVAYGGFHLLHWSSTQATIAQSSCEAELIAANTGACEGRLVQNVFGELGMDLPLKLLTDSSSAEATILKR